MRYNKIIINIIYKKMIENVNYTKERTNDVFKANMIRDTPL